MLGKILKNSRLRLLIPLCYDCYAQKPRQGKHIVMATDTDISSYNRAYTAI